MWKRIGMCEIISEIACAYGVAVGRGDWVVDGFWFIKARLLQDTDFVVLLPEG